MTTANDTTIPTTLNIGETFESATWRIHRFATCIRATHIANAGKRGKRCVQIGVFSNVCRNLEDFGVLVEPFLRKAARAASPESMVSLAKACETSDVGVEIHQYRGVDVRGASDRIEIEGEMVRLTADSQNFHIRDKADTCNESTMIQTDKTGPRQVLAWARQNAAAIKSMTFSQVHAALRDMGVASHYFCAVD